MANAIATVTLITFDPHSLGVEASDNANCSGLQKRKQPLNRADSRLLIWRRYTI